MPRAVLCRWSSCAAVSVLITIACSGCLTRIVWVPGKVSEEPLKVTEAWVSPEGSVCLVYRTSMWTTRMGGFDALGHGGEWRRMHDRCGNWAVFDRCMLIPASAPATFPSNESVPLVPAAIASKFVLPRNVGTDSYDEAAVRATIVGWQSLPIVEGSYDEEEGTMLRSRQAGMVAAFCTMFRAGAAAILS